MDLETIRKAIVEHLGSDEFQNLHLAIWQEHGDADPVQQLAEINRAVKWSPQNFPCAEVFVARGQRQNPDGKYHDVVYEVTIFVHVNGIDEEQLDDRLGRLVRTVQDFYLPRTSMLKCALSLGDEDYSPLISNGDGRPYVKSAAQVINIRVQRSV